MGSAPGGYRETLITTGESGCTVHRLDPAEFGEARYRKRGAGRHASLIVEEHARLQWIAGRLSAPEIVSFSLERETATLITTAIPGMSARQVLEAGLLDGATLVDLLADFMRALHGLPATECPFSLPLDRRLAMARERIDLGLVNEDDFDAEQKDWSAEQVWESLQELLPLTPEPVVTHGDFSLDNILIENGRVSGSIDMGLAGVADRYQDIVILWADLGAYGASLQERLLQRYGVSPPDERRLRFHALLNELF